MKIKAGDIVTAVNVELIRPEYRPKSSNKKRIEKCRVVKVYENSALLDITETDIFKAYKNEFNNRIVVSLRKLIWEGTTVKQAVPDKKSNRDKLEAMVIKELKNGHSTLRSIAAMYGVSPSTVQKIKNKWKRSKYQIYAVAVVDKDYEHVVSKYTQNEEMVIKQLAEFKKEYPKAKFKIICIAESVAELKAENKKNEKKIC